MSAIKNKSNSIQETNLNRQMGLLGLAATGICSMIGASIHVVPFMIQRNVPGIGPYVLPAFLFAAVPAMLAAFAYIVLASAMPRAGGSYLYASRSLSPYLGFVASFSQWFGLSIVIGVVSYVIIPFLRDIASALHWNDIAQLLDTGSVRVIFALLILWTFVLINIRGVKSYEKTVVPLMILMFLLGGIVIVAGLMFTHEDFASALMIKEGRTVPTTTASFNWKTFLSASALLFASFIGFDSIAQAGGEAKRSRSLASQSHRHCHFQCEFVLHSFYIFSISCSTMEFCGTRGDDQGCNCARPVKLHPSFWMGSSYRAWCSGCFDE
jgi:amino acid transporter